MPSIRYYDRISRMKKYQDLLKGAAYVTQFGFTIVCPPIVMAMLGLWLQKRFGLGSWVIMVFILIGLITAASSAWSFFRTLDRQEAKKEEGLSKKINYNDHN